MDERAAAGVEGDAAGGERAGDGSVAPAGVGRVIARDEDGARADVAGKARHLVGRAADADVEAGTTRAEGGIELAQRSEEEGRAVGRGPAPPDERRVEDEEGGDRAGLDGRCERRVVVQAEVAAEPEDARHSAAVWQARANGRSDRARMAVASFTGTRAPCGP
nr:hypothetical protein [Tepidiforma sp.]